MKLTEFQNPVGGNKGNITSPGTWWRYILGAVFLSFVFGISQWVVRQITSRLPVASQVATKPFVDQDTVIIREGPTTPLRVVYGGGK